MTRNYYDYSIDELNWKTVVAGFEETDLVIVPLGNVDAYGHLPQGTDGLVAQKMAVEIARQLKAMRTPLIPFAYCPSTASFQGSINIEKYVFEQYVRNLVDGLLKAGAKRIFLLNGHGETADACETICKELPTKGAKAATIGVWLFARNHDKDLFESSNPHGHASEAGTSVMLYLYPELVDQSEAESNEGWINAFPDIKTAFDAQRLMPDGVLGDGSKGTAEKGKALFDRMVGRIVEFINQW